MKGGGEGEDEETDRSMVRMMTMTLVVGDRLFAQPLARSDKRATRRDPPAISRD